MAYEQKPGDVSVFKEQDKKSERAPDWKGSMIVPDGVKPGDKLEVALWAKGDRGTMLAGSAKPPRQREDGAADFRDQGAGGRGAAAVAGINSPGPRASFPADLDDEVPW